MSSSHGKIQSAGGDPESLEGKPRRARWRYARARGGVVLLAVGAAVAGWALAVPLAATTLTAWTVLTGLHLLVTTILLRGLGHRRRLLAR